MLDGVLPRTARQRMNWHEFFRNFTFRYAVIAYSCAACPQLKCERCETMFCQFVTSFFQSKHSLSFQSLQKQLASQPNLRSSAGKTHRWTWNCTRGSTNFGRRYRSSSVFILSGLACKLLSIKYRHNTCVFTLSMIEFFRRQNNLKFLIKKSKKIKALIWLKLSINQYGIFCCEIFQVRPFIHFFVCHRWM